MSNRMRRRVLCRLLAVLCLAAAPFVALSSGPVAAESVGALGWWYQLNNSNIPVPPPTPPNAPEGGIYLQNVTGVGQNAYGAVRFSAPGAVEGDVTFTVTSTSAAAEVALCPATSIWTPAQGGSWDARPEFDCDAGKALGVFNEDATEVTFGITDALSDGNGNYDLAVVADPIADVSLEVGLTTPGGRFFTPTATSPSTLPPVSEPTPQPTFSSPPPTASSFDSGSSFGSPVPTGGSTTDVGGFLEPEPTPTTQVPVTVGDEVAAPTPVTPIASTSSSAERVLAGIGLVLLAGGLWFIGTRRDAVDPALAANGAITAAGGIGRFAKVRTEPPVRLT